MYIQVVYLRNVYRGTCPLSQSTYFLLLINFSQTFCVADYLQGNVWRNRLENHGIVSGQNIQTILICSKLSDKTRAGTAQTHGPPNP